MEELMLTLRVALLDADSRVLIVQNAVEPWDMPGVVTGAASPLEVLVQELGQIWQVTTFAKAFFPLTFALDDATGHATLLYGCRNWIGPNTLQRVPERDGVTLQWVRSARLGDYAVSDACRMMMPVLMQLVG